MGLHVRNDGAHRRPHRQRGPRGRSRRRRLGRSKPHGSRWIGRWPFLALGRAARGGRRAIHCRPHRWRRQHVRRRNARVRMVVGRSARRLRSRRRRAAAERRCGAHHRRTGRRGRRCRRHQRRTRRERPLGRQRRDDVRGRPATINRGAASAGQPASHAARNDRAGRGADRRIGRGRQPDALFRQRVPIGADRERHRRARTCGRHRRHR